MAKILSVTSGRSGTGKTTLALNIASGLKNKGRVVFIDTGANLPALGYDTNFFKNPYTFADVVNRKIELDLALRDFSGIKYLIGSWNPIEFKKIPSERILEVVDDLSYDFNYIIFDSMLSKETINVLSATKEVALVTKPLLEEISDLNKLTETMDGKKVGLVANMVGRVRDELSIKAIEFLTQTNVVGQIPYDKHVLLALSARKPVVEFNPNCPASKEIIRFTSDFVMGKLRLSRIGVEELKSPTSSETTHLNSKLKSISEKLSSLETEIDDLKKLFGKKFINPVIIE